MNVMDNRKSPDCLWVPQIFPDKKMGVNTEGIVKLNRNCIFMHCFRFWLDLKYSFLCKKDFIIGMNFIFVDFVDV